MQVVDENQIDKNIFEFLNYYKIMWGHIQQTNDYFELWNNFMADVAMNPDIANQCPSFVHLTLSSYLETCFMGVARLYDNFEGKQKGFSLRGLADELNRVLPFISVENVSYTWHNPNVNKYIRKKWGKKEDSFIKSDNGISITLELPVDRYPEFIRSIANSMKNQYKKFFELRNCYFAHNDYDFGCDLSQKKDCIKDMILSDYEELLLVCRDCLFCIRQMFYKNMTVYTIPPIKRDLGDMRLLFYATHKYIEDLPLLDSHIVECNTCHMRYQQKLYRTQPDYESESLNTDLCPYCFHDNGKRYHMMVVNMKEGSFMNNLIQELRKDHLLLEG